MHQETDLDQAVFLKSQHENIADTDPRDLWLNERCRKAIDKIIRAVSLWYVQHVLYERDQGLEWPQIWSPGQYLEFQQQHADS